MRKDTRCGTFFFSLPKNDGIDPISATADERVFACLQAGMKKADYWDPTFEDMLTLIARLPRIAALIYRHVYRNGEITKLVRTCAPVRAGHPRCNGPRNGPLSAKGTGG